MSVFDTMKVSMSGLSAQRLRMDVIASNVANVETTRTPDGGPYLRRQVVFRSALGQRVGGDVQQIMAGSGVPLGRGVTVSAINTDDDAVKEIYDPTHPDADPDGNVLYPDIDLVTEMTDMMAATRAYEANVTVLNASKNMALQALQIGR
jgi:flagellar basal-body rod protein FlgC